MGKNRGLWGLIVVSTMAVTTHTHGFSVNVSTEAELNTQIANFNAETSGDHTITITSNITLTGPLTAINANVGPRLFLQGSEPGFVSGENIKFKTLNGDNSHQILNILGSSRVRIDRLNFINGNNTVGEGRGGAIAIAAGATVSIFSCRFADNQAVGPGMFGTSGGAIYNQGSLNLGNSLFLRNIAPNTGGAITNTGPSGDATIVASTFVDNYVTASAGFGAAVYNSSLSTMEVLQSTFVGNTLGSNKADLENDGGTLMVQSSLFAADTDVAVCLSSGSGNFTDGGHNVSDNGVSSAQFCGMVNGVNNNIVTNDAMIGALSLTGGYAESIPLLEGSPAIDNGLINPFQNTDQRGITKNNDAPDTGAFEFLKSDQFENNEVIGAATEIASPRTIDDLNLSSKAVADEDFFKVSLRGGEPARFAAFFKHSISDIDMVLFDSDGNEVTSSISTTDNEELNHTPAEDGEYFVEVFSFNDDQAYYDIEFDFVPIDDSVCIPIKTQNGSIVPICL